MFDRLYWRACLGAVGGVAGTMLFGVFADRASVGERFQQLIGGGMVGGLIGYFVLGAEGLYDRSARRFWRLATYGLVFGAAGGALAIALGYRGRVQTVLPGLGEQSAVSLRVLAWALRWMVLGVFIGMGDGAATRSVVRLGAGALGGGAWGTLGGSVYGLILEARQRTFMGYAWADALGVMVLGVCIGGVLVWVQWFCETTWVQVVEGVLVGRRYGVVKLRNVIVRDECAEIPLPDTRVEPRHALIRRVGGGFVLENVEARPTDTRLNQEILIGEQVLADGDRITVGGTTLRFETREGMAKAPRAVAEKQEA